MSFESLPRVLLVDDDQFMLQLYRLQLVQQKFQIELVSSPVEALERINQAGPYAVVVADLHMPEMSGEELLERIQEIAPDTMRVMLTADPSRDAVIEALNRGHVFEFLSKPCEPAALLVTLESAVAHYQLREAEKRLHAKTISGSLDSLLQMLSLVNPLAVARAMRVHLIVKRLCAILELHDAWELHTASLLSQIGCVVVPDTTLRKLQLGELLSRTETQLYASHPEFARNLLAKIPRLQRVSEIVARQEQTSPIQSEAGRMRGSIAWRARLLKCAMTYDLLIEQGWQPKQARHELELAGDYDPDAIEALRAMADHDLSRQIMAVGVTELTEGVVLVDDILDDAGMLLVTKGQELTGWMLERLLRQRETGRHIREPIHVLPPRRLEAREPILTSSAEIEFPLMAN